MICYRVYAKLIFLVSLVENLFFPLLYRCYCWICVCCWSSICWNFFFPFASWCAKHYCLNFNDPIWFTIQYFYLILHLSHLFSFLSFYLFIYLFFIFFRHFSRQPSPRGFWVNSVAWILASSVQRELGTQNVNVHFLSIFFFFFFSSLNFPATKQLKGF